MRCDIEFEVQQEKKSLAFMHFAGEKKCDSDRERCVAGISNLFISLEKKILFSRSYFRSMYCFSTDFYGYFGTTARKLVSAL